MNDIMIALVTGANKGIGREIAGQLAALGHTVVIGARSPEAGEKAAAELRATSADVSSADASSADVSSVVLDVTDPASAEAAAREIEARHGRLDALVNNAGVSRPPGNGPDSQRPSTADLGVIRAVFETNVFGVITVTNAMLPLLRRSRTPRIVNVSSSAGSFTRMTDPALAGQQPINAGYVPSKSALTALTMQYARELKPDGILVNAVCPGYVATALNNFSGYRTPAQGAVAAVRMATIAADGPTGTFTDEEGTVPW